VCSLALLLLVESDSSTRETLSERLVALGFTVALDASTALGILRTFKVDAALVQLGGGGGYDLSQSILQVKSIPVFLYSIGPASISRDNEDEAGQCESHAADVDDV
jgi:DNA-binding response OmpR family regulator